MILGKTALYRWWALGISRYWRRRRFERMMRLVRLPEGKLRVLEVGCGEGKDVLQFMAGDSRYELWAVDILPQELRWEGCGFRAGRRGETAV